MKMTIGSVVKGIAMGAAVGAAWYAVSKASERERRSMKRHVGRALKEAGAALDDMTSVMR